MEKKNHYASHVLLRAILLAPALTRAENSAALVQHGKYLVERVGMCADCHSSGCPTAPMTRAAGWGGTDIGFKPIHPLPEWEDHAPRLAGLPHHWTAAQTKHYRLTGLTPRGHHSKPPMPEVRLSAHGADSVVAYLASLKK